MVAEKAEISIHLVRVFRWLTKRGDSWTTANEIAAGAKVAPRTARAHACKLVGLGICDQAEVFPGHRYRISKVAEKRNKGFLLRLRAAESVFGSIERT